MRYRDVLFAALIALCVAAGYVCIVGGIPIMIAQTEPPANWQPADSQEYTIANAKTLWNGESGSVSGERYTLTTEQPHSGVYAAIGATYGPPNDLDVVWTTPIIQHMRIDLTQYDEVWMWVRVISSAPTEVTVYGAAYGLGETKRWHGTVGSEWTLLQIPVSELDAANETLRELTDWRIIVKSHDVFCVDDIWAVKLGPATEPTVEPLPVDPPVEPAPVTYSKWSIQSIAATVTWSRVGSDGVVETQVIPVTLSIGAPQVTP